jgi:hypothetical protein
LLQNQGENGESGENNVSSAITIRKQTLFIFAYGLFLTNSPSERKNSPSERNIIRKHRMVIKYRV